MYTVTLSEHSARTSGFHAAKRSSSTLESLGMNWLSSLAKFWTDFIKSLQLSTMAVLSRTGHLPIKKASRRTCQRCGRPHHPRSYSRSSSSSSCCLTVDCNFKQRSGLVQQSPPSATKPSSISAVMLPFFSSVSFQWRATSSSILDVFSQTSPGDWWPSLRFLDHTFTKTTAMQRQARSSLPWKRNTCLGARLWRWLPAWASASNKSVQTPFSIRGPCYARIDSTCTGTRQRSWLSMPVALSSAKAQLPLRALSYPIRCGCTRTIQLCCIL